MFCEMSGGIDSLSERELTVPRRYFFCGYFMFFLSCVNYAFVPICLYVPCGHLLGKG